MSKIITVCPSCKSKDLNIIKVECENCKTKFEGNFEIPHLLQLSDDDLQFILDFVKCSGSLKEMAKKHNVSYPTFRNRLNSVIDKLNETDNQQELQKSDILKMLESGKITAKEAAQMLYNL
jgi:hypothetical protein